MCEAESHEQRNGRRQHFRSEGKQGERQAHVGHIGEHHRRDEGAPVVVEHLGKPPADQARSEKHDKSSANQGEIIQDVEILGRHRCVDQQRVKQVRAQTVDLSHVGLAQLRVTVPKRGDDQYRGNDADDSKYEFHDNSAIMELAW